MNICMCGSQSGYPHAADCPYPYYGHDAQKESAWMDEYRKNKNSAEQTQPLNRPSEPTYHPIDLSGK